MTLRYGRRPIVIAHRGGAAEAPENTTEAFERAIELGYPGVEFDVRRSRDGVAIVLHDELARVEGKARRVPVATLDAAALAGVPTLERVLGLSWGDRILMIEVKPTREDRALGAQVASAVAAGGRSGQSVIASFSHDVLRAAQEAAPEVALMGLLDKDGSEADFDGLPLFAWGVDLRMLDDERVAAWQAGGREVWTWTIKNLRQARRALEAGADGLISDVPGDVLTLL